MDGRRSAHRTRCSPRGTLAVGRTSNDGWWTRGQHYAALRRSPRRHPGPGVDWPWSTNLRDAPASTRDTPSAPESPLPTRCLLLPDPTSFTTLASHPGVSKTFAGGSASRDSPQSNHEASRTNQPVTPRSIPSLAAAGEAMMIVSRLRPRARRWCSATARPSGDHSCSLALCGASQAQLLERMTPARCSVRSISGSTCITALASFSAKVDRAQGVKYHNEPPSTMYIQAGREPLVCFADLFRYRNKTTYAEFGIMPRNGVTGASSAS